MNDLAPYYVILPPAQCSLKADSVEAGRRVAQAYMAVWARLPVEYTSALSTAWSRSPDGMHIRVEDRDGIEVMGEFTVGTGGHVIEFDEFFAGTYLSTNALRALVAHELAHAYLAATVGHHDEDDANRLVVDWGFETELREFRLMNDGVA